MGSGQMNIDEVLDNCYKVYLEKHCLFCLQPQEQLDSFFGKNIRPFQLLFNYSNDNDNTGRVTYSSEIRSECVPNLPPTCQSCFVNFEQLQELHNQMLNIRKLIQRHVGIIREVIHGASPGSKDPSRWNHFKEMLLSSVLPRDQVSLTCELVRNLQRLILGEGKGDYENEDCEIYSSPTVKRVIKLESVETVDDYGSEMNGSEDMDVFNSTDADADPEHQTALESPKLADSDPESENDKEDLEWKIEILKKGSNKKRGRPRKKKQVKVVKGPKKVRKEKTVPALQHQSCDLCGVKVPIEAILEHVQEHVKGYTTKCVNASCPCVFSCQLKMLRHLKESRRCKRVSPVVSTREAAGVSGKCEVCSLRFRSAYHLRVHLKIHEAEMAGTPDATKKECPIPGCNETFYINQNIQYHIYRHDLRSTTTKMQNCSLCDESIELPEMESHLKSFHEVNVLFKCSHCSFVFDNADDKIAHVYTHRDLNGVVCDICNDGVKLKPLEFLRRHYFNAHQLGTSTAVVCQYCGREYFSAHALQTHERMTHPDITGQPRTKNISRSYHCDLCPARFGTSSALKTHKMKVHGSGDFSCSFCSCTLPSHHALKLHLMEHTGTKLIYKCKVAGCGKEFKHRSQLTRHEEICQLGEGEKPHICDICGKGFKRKKGVQEHKDIIHFGKRTRCVCEKCGESFANPESLKNHELIHTGEMPYVCKMCGQAFRNTSTLWRHNKSHEEKGESFKPHGPMKNTRKRAQRPH